MGLERRDFGPRKPSVVNVGDELELDIAAVGKKGDGIARYQGLVIFVPGTSTGQHVRVRISNVARTFAMAEKIG